MNALSPALRRGLERAVERGRVVAEGAAGSALVRLGVGVEPAPAYLSEPERALRRGLRARGRQLGDDVASSEVTLLLREVAYEQWHRLLFARFLEVNGLLRHPALGVPVSLAECAELAEELGEPDGWSAAGRFAAEILPGIFRPGDVSVQVRLAADDRVRLEEVVTGLPAEVFTAEDSLGWVYQFWQSQAKAEVNASGRKIGGADLAPVTQLFTENYMVRFLLQNSLGAWWAARRPESPLVWGFDYLRLAEDGSPAAGSFEGWPSSVAEVTVMDPCCGSGHFLVAAFGMLWRMRAEEDGLSPAAAQDAVLRDNVFGLELDPRCTQIAMFALALEAWKGGGYRLLPVPNVACSGIPANAPLKEWTALAEGDEQLEAGLARLHALFKDADTLGSLIDPVRAAEQAGLESVDWHEIAPLVDRALGAERTDDPAAQVFGDAAAGIARAADLLSQHYTLTATNVPYLGRGKQSDVLKRFTDDQHPDASGDLAAVMLDRSIAMSTQMTATVTPQSWLTQSGFRKFRRRRLSSNGWPVFARLGAGAFDAIGGEVVQPVLSISSSVSSRLTVTVDTTAGTNVDGKRELLRVVPLSALSLHQVLSDPQVRVPFAEVGIAKSLVESATAGVGIQTGDNEYFTRSYWEVPLPNTGWVYFSRAPGATRIVDGASKLLMWDEGAGRLHEFVRERLGGTSVGAWIRGEVMWERRGILMSRMGELPVSLYVGGPYADNCLVIAPNQPQEMRALWAFASSGELARQVRTIDQSLSISPGTVLSAKFDVERWREVAEAEGPLPELFSDNPTQWLFRGGPVGSSAPLQVAVARLLGFAWPDQEPDVLDELVDVDGIVCLPAVGGERPGADRLWEVSSRAFGEEWSPSSLDGLLVEAGGKPGDLAGWLRDLFFKEHCRVFQNRPFIWHVWDGRKDGFSALVNYHRLDRATLEKLTYSTLGWWIDRQRADADAGVVGAELRLAAALDLQRRLGLILEGEPPFDIFVRWKPLEEQPIGWDPDLDDGVRLNVRPFVEAGVLRSKFTVNWKKERGINPDGTERHNDLHHTNAAKRAARGTT